MLRSQSLRNVLVSIYSSWSRCKGLVWNIQKHLSWVSLPTKGLIAFCCDRLFFLLPLPFPVFPKKKKNTVNVSQRQPASRHTSLDTCRSPSLQSWPTTGKPREPEEATVLTLRSHPGRECGCTAVVFSAAASESPVSPRHWRVCTCGGGGGWGGGGARQCFLSYLYPELN